MSNHAHLDGHDPRFQHANAPYYLAHPQPGLEPLSTAFQSRQQPWMLNVHTNYAPHPDRAPAFYAGGPDAQMVGYPESSQRTLLHDAAYANMYAVPFAGAYQGSYSPASATPAEELQNALDSHSLTRTGYRGVQTMSERRTSFSMPEQYLPGRGEHHMYSPGAPARFPAAPGGSPASYPAPPHNHAHYAPPSPYPHLSASDAASLIDVHSPRSASAPYPVPMRRDSMDSVSVPDPISPSSVPGLVFDEGDYDDDSESSLPSAASDVQRLPYRSAHASEERDFEHHHHAAGREWGRAAAYEASAVGLDDAARQAARSPDPQGDNDHSPVTPSEGGHERARPPQKKSKMHQCTICLKMFPRPSGLATHMNSHSGAKREYSWRGG